MQITAFWDIAPCSLVEVHRRFRGAYGLYHQVSDHHPDDGVSISETPIFLQQGYTVQYLKVCRLRTRCHENLKSHLNACV
jgi:hypothetical protein